MVLRTARAAGLDISNFHSAFSTLVYMNTAAAALLTGYATNVQREYAANEMLVLRRRSAEA